MGVAHECQQQLSRFVVVTSIWPPLHNPVLVFRSVKQPFVDHPRAAVPSDRT